MAGQTAELLAALTDPRAYPFEARGVEVHQTHISAVFLAGPFAYKVKKPVGLDFLDYRTLDRRRHFCLEEVRLNRRLAPEVYLGVVPVVRTPGFPGLAVEGPGEPVEWAVKMVRLPAEATLAARLERGELGVEVVTGLAQRLASFHRDAERGPHVSAGARFASVAGLARDNLGGSDSAVGRALHPEVLARLHGRTEEALGRLHGLIEDRADRGLACDTHGDLRLEHVYLFPDRDPPGDLAVVDAIEFDERLRFADPVADAAFPAMDLTALGRRDLASVFEHAYAGAAGDADAPALFPFYKAYRAAVRAKVAAIKASESEVPEADRNSALAEARALGLVALGELETPDRRPSLVLVAGLPGAGKSTLAGGLAARAGFEVVRSDEVRRELADDACEAAPGSDPFGHGRYTDAWTERTYAECLRRAGRILAPGGRVIVDASFGRDGRRRAFLEAARSWGVPALLIVCRADPDTTRRRLDARAGAGDASEADWPVYLRAADLWEPPGPVTSPHAAVLDTSAGGDVSRNEGLSLLARAGLWSGPGD